MIENEPEVVEEVPVVEAVVEEDSDTRSPLRRAIEEGDEAPKPAEPEAVVGATGPAAAEAVSAGASGATGEASPEEKAKLAVKAAEDKELRDLGIKGKASQERFRKLSAESRELSELKKTLPDIQEKAAQQERMIEVLNDTGATSEQLGNTFKYLKAVNSNDTQQLNEAFDFMHKEVLALGKHLGREIGGVDPLEAHPDLQTAVENGLARADALKIATDRSRMTINGANDQRRQQQEREQADLKVAQDTALNGLRQFQAETVKIDPNWNAKLEALQPSIDLMKRNLHPSTWVDEVKRLYKLVPEPKRAAPAPGPAPLRPTGGATGDSSMAHVPKNPLEALRAGIRAANAQ